MQKIGLKRKNNKKYFIKGINKNVKYQKTNQFVNLTQYQTVLIKSKSGFKPERETIQDQRNKQIQKRKSNKTE